LITIVIANREVYVYYLGFFSTVQPALQLYNLQVIKFSKDYRKKEKGASLTLFYSSANETVV